MEHPQEHSLFDRLVAPGALFLGLAASFLGCCLAGYLAGRRNHFHHFERFHVFLSPEQHFYPTVCQVRQLAKSRLDPGKIAVVVGGSSVLQGYSQPLTGLWTRKLQALLGDRYQVINFGVRSAMTAEFGATAAEVLSREYPRLLLITDTSPASFCAEPDGRHYKYFFWDAYCRGWLLPHPRRDDCLRPRGEPRVELEAQMLLNRSLSFNDLWHTLTYTRFCTLWGCGTEVAGIPFTRARRHFPDHDPFLEKLPGYRAPDHGEWMQSMLNWTAAQPAKAWGVVEGAMADAFPEPLRRQTLVLVLQPSPRYRRLLTAGEQAGYIRLGRETARRLERLGFAAQALGHDFAESDYTDYRHFNEAGGADLAAAIAPKVRELARQLGYTR
jgi:hypothetical protein